MILFGGMVKLKKFLSILNGISTAIIISPSDVIKLREIADDVEVDAYIFDNITKLRSEVEPIGNWLNLREQIIDEKEYDKIPVRPLTKLEKRFKAFTFLLPAGHSGGHMERDLINLSMILKSPEVEAWNEIEIMIGIFSGIFHDIGNSIVERYKEKDHFCGHAEYGAFLFGEVAKKILPPKILSLIKFCISAHTNYLEPIKIKRGNLIKIRLPYDSKVGKNFAKKSVWMTRMTDRFDISGPIFAIRHIISNAEPVNNFVAGKFNLRYDNEIDEFKKQTQRDSSNIFTLLGFFKMIADTSIIKNAHTFEDPTDITENIFIPYRNYLNEFVDTIVNCKTVNFSDEKREEAFEDFYQLCEITEPANDLIWKIESLRGKFKLLSLLDREAWAKGFDLLVNKIYPEWFERVKKNLKKKPILKSKNKSLNRIINELYFSARHGLLEFEN